MVVDRRDDRAVQDETFVGALAHEAREKLFGQPFAPGGDGGADPDR